jgi:hypothetical protein
VMLRVMKQLSRTSKEEPATRLNGAVSCE